MGTVIVTVVVTLGIIIAGGFLIYFIGDLIMSLASHGKKDDEIIKNKAKRDKEEINKALAEKYPEDAEKIKNDPDYSAIVLSGGKVEAYNPEEDSLAEENEEENAEAEQVEEEEQEEPEQIEEETKEDLIAKKRQEILERISKLSQSMEESKEEEQEETEEVDMTESSDENNETEEEVETEETAEATEEETTEETTEETIPEEETTDTDDNIIAYSAEELTNMIASEKEELKANEKELRKCKREFIPLRRVKKTLENDEKKLRRKEVLVAKQKVELYGVNNIQDIDEEKAKKLSEDLDLLDGLKLSVQHCQEVMSKNAERYPLLEQIFNLLSTKNAELKESIANHEKMLAKLNGEDTDAE